MTGSSSTKINLNPERVGPEGNLFHWAWTAKAALDLLNVESGLYAIAVEGLSTFESNDKLKVKEEIADLTLYFGQHDQFEHADQCKILQFKYSVAEKDKEFTASYLSKTLGKFAEQYEAHLREHPSELTDRKLSFVFATNRIASKKLKEAIGYLTKSEPDKKPNSQVDTLINAINLPSASLADFLSRLTIEDKTGSLHQIENSFESRVIDWVPSVDVSSQLRGLEKLVKNKATSDGSQNNIIKRGDVLNSFGVLDPKDLLPCEPFLEPIKQALGRPEHQIVLDMLEHADVPVIVHAEGGVGKTVFLQCLEQELSRNNPTVFLDCFAGGNYRIVGKSRHTPKKAGMHLVNSLAFQGLCEPLLPGSADGEEHLAAVRRRLLTVADLLAKRRPGSHLYIFIDAADNAAEQASLKQENCFPTMLIESLSHTPIAGVKLIASCRTHRRNRTYGDIEVQEQRLNPFSREMCDKFVLTKFPDASSVQTSIAYARSNGNGRVLRYLCEQWEGEVEDSQNSDPITVGDLIAIRAKAGQKTLLEKGARQPDIDVLFAALARLPLPIPIDQLANAIGLPASEVQSYCNDLIPLLEQTPEGVVFRDEPADTWFRENAQNTSNFVTALISRLSSRQTQSSYAAFALPEILLEAGKSEEAIKLADTGDYPADMKTAAAKRFICEIRIQAALKLSALEGNVGPCIPLLAKLAMLSTANARCDAYIRNNVALVGGLKSRENAKRLFEDFSGWNGARSARFCIYYAFSQSMDEAAAHMQNLHDWMEWHFDNSDEIRRKLPSPDADELAAIPLYYCLSGDAEKAANWICGASPERFRFDISESLVDCLKSYDQLHDTHFCDTALRKSLLVDKKSDEGESLGKELILALLAGSSSDVKLTARAVSRLKKDFRSFRYVWPDTPTRDVSSFQQSLLDVAIRVLSLNKSAANVLLAAANLRYPSDYDYFGHPSMNSFVPKLWSGIIKAVSKNEPVSRKHFLPFSYSRKHGAKTLESSSDVRGFVLDKSKTARPVQRQHGTNKKIDNSISDQDADKFSATVELIFEAAQMVELGINHSREYKYSDFSIALKKWNSESPSGFYGYNGQELGRLKFNIFEEVIFQCFQNLSESAKKRAAADISRLLLDENHVPETYIRFVQLFSRYANIENVAGKLAVNFSKKIDDLETLEDRADYSVKLTNAIVAIDFVSAYAYFQNGLDKLDGVGNDDYEIVEGLLQLTAAQEGPHIPVEHSQRLMNLCENMMYDADKFWWPLYCSAATRSFPWGGLARSQRWDFRDVADLEYVNGMFAHKLTIAGKLGPKRACVLYGVDKAVNYHPEYGTTRNQALGAIIQAADPSDKKTIASFLMGLTRLDTQIDSRSETWKMLYSKYAEHLIGHEIPFAPQIPISYLNALESDSEGPVKPEEKSIRDDIHTYSDDIKSRIDPIAAGLDPLDMLAIDQQLAELSEDGLMGRPDICLVEEIRKKVTLSKRADFLDVILKLTQLDFHARVYSFREACNAWESSSGFITESRRKYVSSLMEACLPEIFKSDGSFGYRLKQISEISGEETSLLAFEALKLAAKHNVKVSGQGAFALATLLMEQADADSGHKAVLDILSSEALKTDSEKSEGLPSELLDVPTTASQALSELLWVRLGHDNKLMKWRAIYSVVAACQLGLREDIKAIVKLYDSASRTSFNVPEQKYCIWNAREAFLIALRRAALLSPKNIVPLQGWLRQVVSKAPQHVIISRLAADTLEILEQNKSNPDNALLKKLALVHTPKFGYQAIDRHDYGGDHKEADIDFRFEYEFNKYGPAKLGRLFGFDKPTAQKAIYKKIRTIDSETDTMLSSGGRRRYDRYSSHHIDSQKFEHYGEQLVRHAMIMAGSELVLENPVLKHVEDDTCPWEEWLSRFQTTYSDGYLLSDGTDIPARVIEARLVKGERKEQALEINESVLQQFLGSQRHKGFLSIAGYWKTLDGCDVSLRSCLIESRGAIGKCQNLSKEDWHDVWLPLFDVYNEEGDEWLGAGSKDFEPCIVLPEREVGADRWDAFASSVATQRYEPAKFLIDDLGLTETSRFKSAWSNKREREVFISEAWGVDSEKVTASDDRTGKRLLFRKADCCRYLKAHKKKLVQVLNIERYGSSEDWKEEKTLSAGRIVLLDQNGDRRFWKVKSNKSRY